MFFTEEDYKKIEKYLASCGVKDSCLEDAKLPIEGNEKIAIVQNGENRILYIRELIEALSNSKASSSDLYNVTDHTKEKYINLKQAVELVPYKARKIGQIITFLNPASKWGLYQFQGTSILQWNELSLWNDFFNLDSYVIKSILPDEEDLTKSENDGKGNSYLPLKDREYNPDEFSGLGKVILRKNIMEVETEEYGKVKKNVLLQDMINKPNTIYEIRYDFDLNNQEITIPEGCVLDFQGGILKTGTIQFNNTLLYGKEIIIECYCKGILKNSILSPNMFGAKQDGITDDVPFIQQTIELLHNRKGGTCLFKTGTYLIGSINVKLPNCSQKGAIHIQPNISYIGEENTTIKVKDNSNGFEGIFIGNDNYDSNNISFDNLIFDFNGVNNLYKQEWVQNKTTFFMAGIRVCYATDVKITNSIFKENPGLNCIILGYTTNGYVGNCSFINVAESVKGNKYIFDHSAIISAGKDFKAENNRLLNDDYIATNELGKGRVSTAIECNACGQIITNNYIENFNIGVLPSPVGTTSLENAVISNNVIKNCNYALSVWCTEEKTANTTSLIFSNNVIESSLNYSFAIDLIRYTSVQTSNIQIVNNVIFSKIKDKQYSYVGVYAGNGIHELSIKGNSFINLSSSGIIITSGKNIQIDNNCMINCGNNLFNSENSSLISLDTNNIYDNLDTPIIDNIIITNNLLGGVIGNNSQVIGFSIFGDVRNIIFRNNTIDKCVADFSLDNMTSVELENNYFNMDHKTNNWPEYKPNIQVSPGSILTDLKRNKIYYKTTKLSQRTWENAAFVLGETYGPTNPDVSSDKVGRIFFNTNTQKPVFCNGVDWLDVDGIKTGIPRKGVSNNRPNMEYVYIQEGKNGFQYYDTTIRKSLRWVDNEWFEYDAEVAFIKRSGTFSNKPIPSNVGFQYFNTDTHKTITWDGTKWWNPDGTEAIN